MTPLRKNVWTKTESQTQYSGEHGKLIMGLIISSNIRKTSLLEIAEPPGNPQLKN